MPATSDILPNRDEDSEDEEREVMMPAAAESIPDPTFDLPPNVVEGVIDNIILLDVYLTGSQRPLVSVPCKDQNAAVAFVDTALERGYIMVDNDIYPLSRVSHYSLRAQPVEVRTIEP